MSGKEKMYVQKRDGRKELVHFDKITSRIQKLCYNLNLDYVDPAAITFHVISRLYSGVTTVELDNLAAETATTMTTIHPDYGVLGARIAVSNLHKETKKSFSEVISDLRNVKDPITKKPKPMINEECYNIIQKNAEKLNSAIIYDRDYRYNHFSFITLERNYLLKINGKVVERPQHMLMRVAIAIHKEDIDKAIETYNFLSEKYFTFASSIFFSACINEKLSPSCYLLTMSEDSIDGIFDTLRNCALISKSGGGIGLNIHCIRAKGTPIMGTNGESNGIVPMLRVFNSSAYDLEQGGNKRSGAYAIYLEPWHADIFEFLDLKKSTGKEEHRARNLGYALWVPDLFMQRVLDDDVWTLMCPHESPGLADLWGENFEELYTRYESEKRFKRQVQARDLWTAILVSQIETGTPYMLYKDSCNRKSNHQNIGTIKCGSLCTEVIQYSSPDEVAVCNLASIAVNMFVDTDKKVFNFEKLKMVTKLVANNLDKMIDVNYCPISETEKLNMRHRSIGIGIQGLADAFLLMRYPFDSEEAQKLNIQIFETLYYSALEASCEIAKEKGSYDSYDGSPVSKGILQYDTWNITPTDLWDWAALKEKIAKYGVRNSLLIALMPTESLADIFGNNDSVEPFTSNIHTRWIPLGNFQSSYLTI
ncbi:ribonucleoside-diphosphate reductase large subunit-like isoform X2 [Prorops nasuta]|uniref:ribonucleoside-diphosphate reductase large subunit-like isoform X2 n=1 Tax=Prorops nasuta TaxID=863751 RepID=UPI0034CF1FC8